MTSTPRQRTSANAITTRRGESVSRISPAYRKRHTRWQHPAVFDGCVTHREPEPTASRRVLLGALLALLLALIGAGCSKGSSGSGTAGSSDSTAPTADIHAQGVKFAECMRENGVPDFPDPNASGDFEYGVSVSPEQWMKTLDACKELQPPGTLSADRSPEEQSAALKFAQCIRDHGVKDFPDPVNGEPIVDTTKIPSSDSEAGMAILNAAMHTCSDLGDEAVRSQRSQP